MIVYGRYALEQGHCENKGPFQGQDPIIGTTIASMRKKSILDGPLERKN